MRRSVVPALTFGYIAFTLVTMLDLVSGLHGRYHPFHVIYSGVLIVCMVAMSLYLIAPRGRLPFFQMICLLYGLHYAVFPFLGVEAWYYTACLAFDNLAFTATLTVFGALIVMFVMPQIYRFLSCMMTRLGMM